MRRLSHSARVFLGATLAAALFLAPQSVAFAAPADPSPAAPVPPEVLKAAFLVNFVRFTEWPAIAQPATAPYSIGISGNRALEDELIRLADRQLVRGRRLRVVRIKHPGDLEGLHVAYFDFNAPAQLDVLPAREALPLLRRRPVLTVSDAGDFIAAGGMVRIFREEKALRFEIATDLARDSGLAFSSRLLALARIHRSDPPVSSTPPASSSSASTDSP